MKMCDEKRLTGSSIITRIQLKGLVFHKKKSAVESSSGLDFHCSASRSILIVSSLSCLLHYGKKAITVNT